MTVLYYEPTWEGFLTGVFAVFARRGEEILLRRRGAEGSQILFSSETLSPDPVRAGRVERGVAGLDRKLAETVYTAWLSERAGIEDDIVACLKIGFERKTNPMDSHLHPGVSGVCKAARDVGWEAQRMRQFVRFVQAPEDIYVADIEPLYNVLTLIGEHFHGRFGDQRLLIRDVRRRVALVSQPEGWHIRRLPDGPLPPLPEDGAFEELWRGYFQAIANPARLNTRLQQHFIPLRYRRFLTEFQPGSPVKPDDR